METLSNYLLDTHALIWFFERSPYLPTRIKEIIAAPENKIYVSTASLWEIAIKINLGKLILHFSFGDFLGKVRSSVIELLPIEDEYLKRLSAIPPIHKDPFDRLMIAAALVDNLIIITVDSNIQKYDVSWIW